uniref:FkbM family methyltransferase n=1 Tax=uncultured Succinivibrio sp. TaxID=540749 RepID=UPI0025DD2048
DYIKKNKIDNVEPINVATGSETGEIGFHSTENMNSIVVKGEVSNSDKLVKIVKLDDYFSESPTLIKMDIEGAELDSLKGASEIISKLKPKLAICIYHLPLDFYEIPKYLKALVPEYKFKIRQHEDLFWETVLYAYI